jgi:putative ABC transport system permease protein
VRFLNLVIKNTARNKRRTALTVVSLMLSLFLFVFFETVFDNWSQSSASVPESKRRLIVRNLMMTNFMPISHAKLIARVPNVAVVHPWVWFMGRLKDRPKDLFTNMAVDLDTFQATWGEYRVDAETMLRWKQSRQGCLVGKRLLTKYGWRRGSRLTLGSDVLPGCEAELEVIGTYEGGQDEETLFFDLKYVHELVRGTPYQDQVGAFCVIVSDLPSIPRVIEGIDSSLKGSQAPTKTETEKDFILGVMSMVGDVRGLMMKATVVVLGVVFLVVMNTMAMSVRERTREVAVLKALGFSPRLVVSLVIGEGVFTALIGGAIGTIGTRLVFELLGRPTVLVYFPNFYPSWTTVGTGLAIAFLIGLFSSVVPALQASRIEVVKGLRRVG